MTRRIAVVLIDRIVSAIARFRHPKYSGRNSTQGVPYGRTNLAWRTPRVQKRRVPELDANRRHTRLMGDN